MAGGISKTIGIVAIILGVVLILSGGAAVGYAYMEDGKRSDQNMGLGYSQEDREQIQMLGYAGIAAAAGGLVFVVLGIVLVSIGAGRARRELLKGIAAAGGREAGTTETETTEGEPARGLTPKRLGITAGAAAIVVLLLAVPLLMGGSLDSPFRPGTASDAPVLVSEKNLTGSTAGGSVGPVGSISDGASNVQPFVVPQGATRLVANLTWDGAAGGAETLRLIIEVQTGDAWREVARAEGGSPVTLTTAVAAEDDMRASVWVAGFAAAGAPQEYQIALQFWDR